ncbi:ParB/RepB/Spo0J family partition protein [Arthrobacter sp. BB-1]|uniref:ParB/RepB/Spo0J family partition protein n=1 Tax=unclassified Arthrobacter TaxID=235627 RepID=UPI001111DB60|nr:MULTISPECIES: ParB/RepB/Spo0J family partition protein [unclassified Arthrobacter]TNB77057.1 ParB/RepB/Spo0J family partition protein [Arthrobacter sp. BB-1]
MSEKRRGLGRGLGALIPSSAAANGSGNGSAASRPVDLFFPEGRRKTEQAEDAADNQSSGTPAGESPATPSTRPSSSASPAGKSPAETSATSKPRSSGSSAAKRDPGESAASTEITPDLREDPAAASVSAPASADSTEGMDEPTWNDSGVELVEVPGVRFAEIPVSDIHPNRKQPRSVFDEDDMAELVHSVREIGVLQPIVVRKSTESGGEPFELVMGERRWRAVQAAGLETIPAIVRDTTDDDLLRDALLENLHRSQLNPLEEAAAYQQLLEDFGTTHEQLADRIGRSRPQVSNTLRLLKLPPLVQRRVAAGVISAGHARALLALPDAAAMERLAQKIVAEGMSVRATEEAVTMYQDPAKPAKNNIPRPGARHERLDYLASSLSDRLDTNVKISLGVRKGKVSIEFASVEDLNRIMDVLAPGSNN